MTTPVNIPALLRKAKPAVKIENGKTVTSSVEVARVFDKQHRHVLDAIKNLLADLPPEYLPNFRQVSIEYQNGKGGTQTAPAYHLTRDGFTLLAMGFTGKKALAFKLAYIDAFNRLEAGLRPPEIPRRPLPPLPSEPLPPPPQTQSLPFPPPPKPESSPTKTLTFSVPLGETGQRWLLHTDRHGREHVTELSPETHIGTPAKIVSMLMTAPADLHLDYGQQLAIINTFLHNLHQSAAGYGKRLGLKPGGHP